MDKDPADISIAFCCTFIRNRCISLYVFTLVGRKRVSVAEMKTVIDFI